MQFRTVIIFSAVLLSRFIFLPPAFSGTEEITADGYMHLGMTAYEKGNLGNAVEHWDVAARRFEDQRRYSDQCGALIKLSQVCVMMGQHKKAEEALARALEISKKHKDKVALLIKMLG